MVSTELFTFASMQSIIAGKAFCEAHCTKVAELGYPVDLKEFLKSCSNEKQSVDPNEYCKPMKQRVDEELKKLPNFLLNPTLASNLLLTHRGLLTL